MYRKTKRGRRLFCWAAAILSFLSGCSSDFYAYRLIRHGSVKGKLEQFFNSNPQKLIDRGRISSHHRVTSFDGTEIDAWVLNPDNKVSDKGTILMIHGLWDTKTRFYSTALQMRKKGYNVVLHDQRGHGFSGGKFVTYGANEKKDVKALADALLEKGVITQPLYAVGHSMGAATSIQYAAIDPRCKAVVALAPFSDMRAVTRRIVPLMKETKFSKVMQKVSKLANFEPRQASPLEEVGKLGVPLLIIHGRLDTIVPWDQGREIYDAAPCPKEFIDIEYTGHLGILLGRSKWIADQIERTIQKSQNFTSTI